MTGELLLTDMSFSFWHFPFVMLLVSAYIIFQWIYVHRIGAFYQFFLDYDKPGAIFWYTGLIIGVSYHRLVIFCYWFVVCCNLLLSICFYLCLCSTIPQVTLFFFLGIGAYYICGHHTFRGEIVSTHYEYMNMLSWSAVNCCCHDVNQFVVCSLSLIMCPSV